MSDASRIVGAGEPAIQLGDFTALPALARRLGIRFDDPAPPRSLRLRGVGGVSLHALDWGRDGPPVLFLHGGRLTARTWDYVCLGLRRRVRAVALDLRGHGDSGWRDDGNPVERCIGDIGAVLDALAWPSAHLVGMSLGGLVAGHFAAAAPQRVASLTMVDVGPGVVFEATARMRDFFERVDPRGGPEAMLEAAMSRMRPVVFDEKRRVSR